MREAADMIRTATDYEPAHRVAAHHAWAMEIFRRGMEAERLRQRHVADQHAAAFVEAARAVVENAAAGFYEDVTRSAQHQAEIDSQPWYEKTPLRG